MNGMVYMCWHSLTHSLSHSVTHRHLNRSNGRHCERELHARTQHRAQEHTSQEQHIDWRRSGGGVTDSDCNIIVRHHVSLNYSSLRHTHNWRISTLNIQHWLLSVCCLSVCVEVQQTQPTLSMRARPLTTLTTTVRLTCTFLSAKATEKKGPKYKKKLTLWPTWCKLMWYKCMTLRYMLHVLLYKYLYYTVQILVLYCSCSEYVRHYDTRGEI